MRTGALPVLVACLGLLPATAQGQSRESAPVPGITSQWNAAPQAVPAAPDATATPPIQPVGASDPFRAGPDTYAPRFNRSLTPSSGAIVAGYGLLPGAPQRLVPSRAADLTATGRLYLRVTPGSSQVFVDGLYVGVADDFDARGHGLVLETGPRRVELRRDGYDPVTVDVRIVAGETLTYQKDLVRAAARPEPPRAALKTFYVIPGCYAGDTTPQPERLPSGCRVADLRTIPPVLAVVSPAPLSPR